MHTAKAAITKIALFAFTLPMLFSLLAGMGAAMPQKVQAQTETGNVASFSPSASNGALFELPASGAPIPGMHSLNPNPLDFPAVSPKTISLDRLFKSDLRGYSAAPAPNLASSFTAATTAGISGKVTDNNGSALPGGASILVTDYETNQSAGSAATLADGTFTVAPLTPGTYRVMASSGNYVAEWYPNTPRFAQALPVTVKKSAVTKNINFSLDPGGMVLGTVISEDGPLAGISVAVLETSSGLSRAADTDAEGKYTINGVPYGSYRIYAPAGLNSADAPFAREYYNNQASYDQATVITVSTTQNPPPIDFSLETGGGISGHVFESTGGAPIQNAAVAIFEFDSEQFVKEVQTDTSGFYTFPGLASGNYYVVAWAAGHTVNWYKTALWSTLSEPVSVTAPYRTPNIDFNLGPGGTISGNIKSGSANLFDVSVAALAADYPYGWATTTDVFGNYTLFGLPYGSYKLFAPAGIGSGDNLYAMQFNKNTMDPAKATSIVVSATAPAVVKKDFKLVKGGSITGTITDSQDVPIAGAWVEASEYTSNLYIKGAYSAADGTYTLAGMATGKFKVNAWAEGHVRLWYNNSAFSSQAAAVTVKLPKATAGINFKLAEGATISGSIISDAGKTLQRVSVVALGQGVNGGGGALSDKYGNYTIEGLPFGDYLVASPWGFGPGDADYARQYYDQQGTQPLGELVSLTSPNPKEDIDFTLSTGGAISGHVREIDGITPLPGATVTVRDYDTGSFIKSAQTAADGSYNISGLPTDNYRVEAWKSGRVRLWYAQPNTFWFSEAGQVQVVKPDETENIDFNLDMGGSISGNVKNAKTKTIKSTNLANVSVNASPSGNTAVGAGALTDNLGNYTITGLPLGSYLLSAPAGFGSGDSDYIKLYYDKAATTAKAKAVVLSQKAATAKSKNFILTMGGSISGLVFQSAESHPLQAATVMAFAPNTLEAAAATLTGSDGTFIIHGLAAGAFYVTAFKDGYERRWNPNTIMRSEAQPVTVVVNSNVATSDFKLGAGGSISGTVTFAGNPVSGVGVAAMSPGFPPTLEWIDYTDSDGKYTVSSLAYGGYLIYAPATGGNDFNSYIKKYYFNSITSESASPVPIPDLDTQNTNITDINITLSQGAPEVVETYPTKDYYNASRTSPIKIVFSKSMSQSATQSAFSIIPKAAGKFSWNHDSSIMSFSPSSPLAPDKEYTVKITAKKTKDLLKPAQSIPADYTFSFNTINAAGDASIPVTIEAPSTAAENSTFSVKIHIKNVNRLNSYFFELSYDPAAINFAGANPGVFSSDTFPLSGWNLIPAEGNVRILGHFSGTGYVNGEGFLVELLFKVVGSINQSSQLHLWALTLVDDLEHKLPLTLPADATITITP